MGLNGVDVASYQSKLKPSAMTTTQFVIVKFTQGAHYLNPYADRQYGGAKSAGKLLGSYHYAEGGNAKTEAQYFVKALGNRVGECILALDWEGMQNPTFGSGKDVTWCLTWLNEVYRLTGSRPLIYMSKSVCRKYDWSAVAQNYGLWCAQYGSNNRTDYQNSPWTDSNGFGAWKSDTIRQYSSKGRITGYGANIDINKAYLTADQWRAMAKGTYAKAPEAPKQNPIDVAISIADAEVGYREGANNHTKYGDTMHELQPRNMDKNAAWCDAFVDWVIYQTCKRFGYGAETARQVLCGDFDDYTYNSVALYKKAGRWAQTPKRGDQIFFGGSGHTGIVTSVSGGIVNTIEGNKGDKVTRCSYSKSSPSIIGYGRPKYELIGGTIPESEEYDMPQIQRGSKGKAVKILQIILGDLEVDGSFGPATQAATLDFQRKHGLTADGIVGPKTWRALFDTL